MCAYGNTANNEGNAQLLPVLNFNLPEINRNFAPAPWSKEYHFVDESCFNNNAIVLPWWFSLIAFSPQGNGFD